MHEVFVEEKQKKLDESFDPSKKHDTRSTSRQKEKKIEVKKGKEKLGPTVNPSDERLRLVMG
jgi:hypothetical protein